MGLGKIRRKSDTFLEAKLVCKRQVWLLQVWNGLNEKWIEGGREKERSMEKRDQRNGIVESVRFWKEGKISLKRSHESQKCCILISINYLITCQIIAPFENIFTLWISMNFHIPRALSRARGTLFTSENFFSLSPCLSRLSLSLSLSPCLSRLSLSLSLPVSLASLFFSLSPCLSLTHSPSFCLAPSFLLSYSRPHPNHLICLLQ